MFSHILLFEPEYVILRVYIPGSFIVFSSGRNNIQKCAQMGNILIVFICNLFIVDNNCDFKALIAKPTWNRYSADS